MGSKTFNLRPLAGEFLVWCNDNFDCCWLTAWQEGMIKDLVRLIYAPCAAKWRYPTLWKTNKTESIDFNEDFVWVDDDVSEAEMNDMQLFRRQGRMQEVVHVDPRPCDHLPWIQRELESFLDRWRINERMYGPMDKRFNELVAEKLNEGP